VLAIFKEIHLIDKKHWIEINPIKICKTKTHLKYLINKIQGNSLAI